MKRRYIIFNKYLILYFLIGLASLIGCKKGWLEEKSDKSLTVPTSLKDFQALLDNSDIMSANNPYSGEISADGHYMSDATYQARRNSELYQWEADRYIWNKTAYYKSLSDWTVPYQKILYDNIILDGLNKITPLGEAEREQFNNVKGQALFNRANSFFDLAQIFAVPYSQNTASQDLGIVLRLSSDITLTSKRSTIAATYSQILKDLNEAKDLLPNRPLVLTRPSKSATYALLSRIYLSMGDYESAFATADNSLKIFSKLLDYNTISSDADFIGLFNVEVLIHKNYYPGALVAEGLIEKGLYDLYDDNDLRKTRFYRKNLDGTISFKGNYESVTYNMFCGLATDEVYLTRAECYARAGKIAEAMKDLNDLLIKRWNKNASYQPIIALSSEDALYKILQERKKELIFRGTRWMDLRRLNKEPRFAVTLKRTAVGVDYTLEPNSYKYTFPIPDDIIEQTGIQQNPEWP